MSVSKENSTASEVLDSLSQSVHVKPENLRLAEVCLLPRFLHGWVAMCACGLVVDVALVFLNILEYCDCLSTCMCVVCCVRGARKGWWTPWNLSYNKWLQVAVYLLGMEPTSSGRIASARNAEPFFPFTHMYSPFPLWKRSLLVITG